MASQIRWDVSHTIPCKSLELGSTLLTSGPPSPQIATICAMVSIGGSVLYRPKDKQVFADNAHKNFSRGNVGDHIALLNIFDQWAETNFSTQWCFENYVQVGVGCGGDILG